MRTFVLLFVCMLLTMKCARGQQSADFPEPHNNEQDAGAEPMDASQAAAMFRLPSGFQAQVFAAEPQVQNPIDMAWDAKGRIWIAENYTYSSRQERFDLSLRDRVVVLSDHDGDGVADQHDVFVDNVQMLTSVEVGYGGVWLMCPPQLLFVPDADHDAKPDSDGVRVVLDGFTVAKQNYHNFANGLRFGPDGWLYGRCGGSCPGRIGPPGTRDEERVALEGGIWRYHPVTGQHEVLTHGTTNPWGHDWDANGEGFYINTVNGHFWHLIPGAHFTRPFTLDPNPLTYELIDTHADHWHFDTSGAWQDSRDGAANEFGGGHAHCGMMVYLGDQWPQSYRGAVMTVNLHGKRVNHDVLHARGAGYVAGHSDDFCVSADPFFRGMELSYGPDGSVYLIDWSDTGECHDHTGVHRTSGRVFRIRYNPEGRSSGVVEPVNLYEMRSESLVALQKHENEWFARQARLVLAERSVTDALDAQSVEQLQSWLAGDDRLMQVRSVLTLGAVNQLETRQLLPLLTHENPYVRAWAVRLLTAHLPLDDCYGQHPRAWDGEGSAGLSAESLSALQLLAESEMEGIVRLTLASTLQRLALRERFALATALAGHREDANDHNLPLLVWYGLMTAAEAMPEELARFAVDCQWPKTQRLAIRYLASRTDQHSTALGIVMTSISKSSDAATRHNILGGLSDGLKGWRQAIKPDGWDAFASLVARDGNPDATSLVRELSVVFGDGRALAEMHALILDQDAEIGLRRSALRSVIRQGSDELFSICEPLLRDPRINVDAAQGLAKLEGPAVAQALIKNYGRFRAPERPKVVAILSSRADWAKQLLTAVSDGAIRADDVSAFDIRQMRSMGDAALDQQIARSWGNVRESSTMKRTQIERVQQLLTSENRAHADLANGRRLFEKTCQQCHRMYGQGEKIGPDLTGADRGNIDYVTENVVDPSAVVSKDFRMTVLLLTDGRVINGLVLSENQRVLEVQTQTEKQTIPVQQIEDRRLTTQSPMPEGLLDNLTDEQIRDLLSYVMHPSQVALDR